MAANSSDARLLANVVLHTSLNAASALVCLFAAIMMCSLKLHTSVVYRLALYQVLASLALAMTELMQVYRNSYLQGWVCTAIGWSVLYSRWVKLLFTMWVSVHLVSFGVLHKNLKNFEVLYVVTSLLLPTIVACIPLATQSYGATPFGGCFLRVQNDSQHAAIIEEFILWDVPSMVILLGASAAMIVMVIKLTRKVCARSKYRTINDSDHDQFWNALKQLLPLTVFPILFFIFQVPMLIFHIYSVYYPSRSTDITMLISITVFVALWTMTSGLTLLVHIAVARCYVRRNRNKVAILLRGRVDDFTPHYQSQSEALSNAIFTERRERTVTTSATHFPMPRQSCDGVI